MNQLLKAAVFHEKLKRKKPKEKANIWENSVISNSFVCIFLCHLYIDFRPWNMSPGLNFCFYLSFTIVINQQKKRSQNDGLPVVWKYEKTLQKKTFYL